MNPWIHGSAAGAAAGAAASAAAVCILSRTSWGARSALLDFHSKVLIPGLGGGSPVRSPICCVSSRPALLQRSNGKKICALLAALRSGSVFSLELSRWASILLARTVLGLDLPCQNDRFADSHAARARATPTSSNSVKTLSLIHI